MSGSGVANTIYLFTTTPQNRKLYKRDLLNVSCYPDNSIVRFSYKNKWVREDLLRDGGRFFEGKSAVIVYCSVFDKADVYYRYYPIRRGRIHTAQVDQAGSLSLTVVLKEFYDYSASDIEARIDEFQAFVQRDTDRPDTLRSDRLKQWKKRYVRSTAAIEKPEYWTGTWEPLVYQLSRLNGLNDSVFFRIEPKIAIKRNLSQRFWDLFESRLLIEHFPSPRWHDVACRPEWHIDAGRSYDRAIAP